MNETPPGRVDPGKIAEANRLLVEQRSLLAGNAETVAELLLTPRSVAEQTVKVAEGLSAKIVGFDTLADHACAHMHPGGPAEPSLNRMKMARRSPGGPPSYLSRGMPPRASTRTSHHAPAT